MAIKTIMTAAQMAKDEKAWLALRNKYIGGSDASSVAGFSKWKSPYQLYLEKTGKQQAEDLSGNMRVWFGKRAEQIVADRFTLDTGKKLRKTGVWVNDKYPWACATLDRMITGENSFLECKTSSGFTKDRWQEGQIPDNYYCQILHYMTIMEMDYCYIACLFDNCSDYVIRKVEFNEDDAAALMSTEQNFWENMALGIEPPVDGSEACGKALGEKFKGGKIEPVELDECTTKIIADLLTAQAQEKEIKQTIQRYQNELKNALGDNEHGYAGNYEVNWTTVKPRQSIDSKLLKKEQPEIYAKYLKEGAPSRRFSIKKLG